MFLRTSVTRLLGLTALLVLTFSPDTGYCQKNTNPMQASVEVSAQPGASALAVTEGEKVSVAKVTAEEEFIANYIHGKLQLGTRSVHRVLTDDDSGHKGGGYGSGTYLGTIYGLDEEQRYAPSKVFINYYFNKYFGVGLDYDSIKVRTLAIDGYTHAEKTDGDAILSGPTLSVFARIPNSTAFTPYFGLGIGFFSGSFDEDPAWATTINDGGVRTRVMDVEDTNAVVMTSGLTWAFTANWLVDLSVQYIQADADATFYGYNDGVLNTGLPGHFPMDNVAFRLGIVYSF
ncbi:MAG: hypothetical protein OEL83_09160 [Desulforhopalus sp.]|nr:hypothetical protein [Desulforhopalus sp.]